MAKKVKGWQCQICKELHQTEEDAMDCCEENKQKEVDGFKCPECGEIYEEEDDAEECCEEEEDSP